MKSGLTLVLAITAVAAAFAATALAGGVKTTVEITSGEGTHFEGTVSSSNPKCLKSRDVSLVFDTGSGTVGTAKTNKDGNWSIDGSFIAGYYHAEVAPKTVGAKAARPHKTKCKGGESQSEQY